MAKRETYKQARERLLGEFSRKVGCEVRPNLKVPRVIHREFDLFFKPQAVYRTKQDPRVTPRSLNNASSMDVDIRGMSADHLIALASR